MKKLRIPSLPILFRTGQLSDKGAITVPLTFYDFVHDNVLTGFGKKFKDIQRAIAVSKKLADAIAAKKDFVWLDASAVDELQSVCESADWNPLLAIQMGPFFQVIADAKASKDEEPAEAPVLGLVAAESEPPPAAG